MKLHSLLAVLLLSIIVSCSPKVPFKQETREKFNLTETELRSLQFYTSGEIRLLRGERSQTEARTADGELKVESGSQVEEVLIPKGTPGIIEKIIDGNTIQVSFEEGPQKYLTFSDVANRKGPYYLQTASYKNNRRQVQYDGKMYVTSLASSSVYLLFKMKHLKSFKKDQRVVKGQKL